MIAMKIVLGLLIWPVGAWWLTEAAAAAQPQQWTRGSRVTIIALAGLLWVGGFIAVAAASVSNPASPPSELVVVKPPQSPARASVGEPVEITFTLLNNSDTALDSVILSIEAPFFGGFAIDSSDPSWSEYREPRREVVWAAPRPARQVEYSVVFEAIKAGTYPLNLTLRTEKGPIATLSTEARVL